MKKILVLLLTCILIISALTACGENSSPGTRRSREENTISDLTKMLKEENDNTPSDALVGISLGNEGRFPGTWERSDRGIRTEIIFSSTSVSIIGYDENEIINNFANGNYFITDNGITIALDGQRPHTSSYRFDGDRLLIDSGTFTRVSNNQIPPSINDIIDGTWGLSYGSWEIDGAAYYDSIILTGNTYTLTIYSMTQVERQVKDLPAGMLPPKPPPHRPSSPGSIKRIITDECRFSAQVIHSYSRNNGEYYVIDVEYSQITSTGTFSVSGSTIEFVRSNNSVIPLHFNFAEGKLQIGGGGNDNTLTRR